MEQGTLRIVLLPTITTKALVTLILRTIRYLLPQIGVQEWVENSLTDHRRVRETQGGRLHRLLITTTQVLVCRLLGPRRSHQRKPQVHRVEIRHTARIQAAMIPLLPQVTALLHFLSTAAV